MNNRQPTTLVLCGIMLIPAFAGLLLSLEGCKRPSQNNGDSIKADAGAGQVSPENKADAAGDAAVKIMVSFKLDPRITRGMYMGDRWVSPSTYTAVGEGKTCTIEAKAVVSDAKGKPMAISPKWIPDNPEMVTVSPNQGNVVKITVRQEGQSVLKVVCEGIAKELLIKAAYKNNATQVEISQ